MREQFCRSAMLLGETGIERLSRARVALFGVGGVGSFCAEALARSGIGSIELFDSDTINESNLNRQLEALHSTIGKSKAAVMAQRIRDINPMTEVSAHEVFYGADNADSFPLERYDYIIDAIDTVTAKLELIQRADKAGVPIISSMGTGNKLDPTRFEIADIYKTSICPLARVMRKELKARGIKRLKVLYSKEEPLTPLFEAENAPGRRQTPGSLPFVPSVAGLIIAGEVIRDLAGV